MNDVDVYGDGKPTRVAYAEDDREVRERAGTNVCSSLFARHDSVLVCRQLRRARLCITALGPLY